VCVRARASARFAVSVELCCRIKIRLVLPVAVGVGVVVSWYGEFYRNWFDAL